MLGSSLNSSIDIAQHTVRLDFDFLVTATAKNLRRQLGVTEVLRLDYRFLDTLVNIGIGRSGVMMSDSQTLRLRFMGQHCAVFRRCMPKTNRTLLIEFGRVLPISNEKVSALEVLAQIKGNTLSRFVVGQEHERLFGGHLDETVGNRLLRMLCPIHEHHQALTQQTLTVTDSPTRPRRQSFFILRNLDLVNAFLRMYHDDFRPDVLHRLALESMCELFEIHREERLNHQSLHDLLRSDIVVLRTKHDNLLTRKGVGSHGDPLGMIVVIVGHQHDQLPDSLLHSTSRKRREPCSCIHRKCNTFRQARGVNLQTGGVTSILHGFRVGHRHRSAYTKQRDFHFQSLV